MIKSIFDCCASGIGLLLLSPLFLLIALMIRLNSTGPVFYKQSRVGKNGVDFKLWKFRTMYQRSDAPGAITIGNRDPRITSIGYYLRKFKLDELPQLINIVLGDMSLVGPRPELRHFVEMYSQEQLKVLAVKPGITDYASIEYSDENTLLASVDDPAEFYIDTVMPAKLKWNLKYIDEAGFFTDIRIIIKTLKKVFL